MVVQEEIFSGRLCFANKIPDTGPFGQCDLRNRNIHTHPVFLGEGGRGNFQRIGPRLWDPKHPVAISLESLATIDKRSNLLLTEQGTLSRAFRRARSAACHVWRPLEDCVAISTGRAGSSWPRDTKQLDSPALPACSASQKKWRWLSGNIAKLLRRDDLSLALSRSAKARPRLCHPY